MSEFPHFFRGDGENSIRTIRDFLSRPLYLTNLAIRLQEKRPNPQPYVEMDAASRPDGLTPREGDVTDAEVLRRVYAGDQRAFRAIVDRHGRYLTGVAIALCGNRADAEDLVQE